MSHLSHREHRAARPRIPADPAHTAKRPTSGHWVEGNLPGQDKRWAPKVRGLWSPAVAEAVRQWHTAQRGPRPNSRRKRRDREALRRATAVPLLAILDESVPLAERLADEFRFPTPPLPSAYAEET